MAFPTGWGRKQKITISATQVSGASDLVNYPMLVTLDHLDTEITDGGANSALNGGGDVRFSSDSAGATQLACDVVTFVTGGTPDVEVWIKVPSASVTTDTTIYIWYNKSGEVQPLVTDTYGRNAVWAGYLGVYHFNNDLVDSTGNGNTLTATGSPSYVAGLNGTAIKFDGSTNYVKSPANAYNTENAYTVGIRWLMNNPLNISAFGRMWSIGGYAQASGGIDIERQSTATNWSYILWGTSNSPLLTVNRAFPAVDTWHSSHLSTDKAAPKTVYYEDATAFNTDTAQTRASIATELAIGAHVDGGNKTGMTIESFYVYNGELTADWITTEENNQINPATFATAGVPEAGSSGGSTASLLLMQRSF